MFAAKAKFKMTDDFKLFSRAEAEELLSRLQRDESPFSSIAVDALRTVLALMDKNHDDWLEICELEVKLAACSRWLESSAFRPEGREGKKNE